MQKKSKETKQIDKQRFSEAEKEKQHANKCIDDSETKQEAQAQLNLDLTEENVNTKQIIYL